MACKLCEKYHQLTIQPTDIQGPACKSREATASKKVKYLGILQCVPNLPHEKATT